jgi:hypothetical protein
MPSVRPPARRAGKRAGAGRPNPVQRVVSNSKRFAAFLRYTVEHALTSTEPLKERIIGHEVFAREPDYDTGQDPVVRMTAAEVRKRLTQYYLLPEHRSERLIAYQPGSYVPEFSQRIDTAPAETVLPAPEAFPSPFRSRHSTTWLAMFALAAGVLATVGTLGVMKQGRPAASDAVARFWAPIGRLLKQLHQTYGLITRVKDPSTDHSVLTVAGLVFGTSAAAECLVDAGCIQSAEQIGGDLNRENVQVVVSAAVIGEDAGAPRVVATHSW